MTINVSVFGLGYVGTVSGACFANQGHRVIGVDKNPSKVECICNGQSPILEPGLVVLLKKTTSAGSFTATTDTANAVAGTDISLISVGTYSSADGYPDLRALFSVMDEIGDALKRKDGFHCIVIRSTVPPGTTDVALTRVAKRSGKRCGTDFGGGMNPEFMREGKALDDFVNPPFVVFGVTDERSMQLMTDLYSSVHAPVHKTALRLAEILKYSCNCFHAVKVSFANEIGRICSAANVDSQELMRIFAQDTILNVSSRYLMPGMPFGGSCLPKDLRGLSSYASSKGVQIPLLRSVLESNDSHFGSIIRTIESMSVEKIGIAGVTFKEDTDDIRESPVLNLARCLVDRGFSVRIFDRILNSRELTGTNKELFTRLVPEWQQLRVDTMKELLDNSDLVVLTNKGYTSSMSQIATSADCSCRFFDLTGAYRHLIPAEKYKGLCW